MNHLSLHQNRCIVFSKSCQHAIRVMVYLTSHSSELEMVGARDLADALNIQAPFLSKILQEMAIKGLISSKKGPNGGFYMTADNKQLTLYHVVQAMDGLDVFTACILGLPACSGNTPCPLHDKAALFRDGLVYQFKTNTTSDLTMEIMNKMTLFQRNEINN